MATHVEAKRDLGTVIDSESLVSSYDDLPNPMEEDVDDFGVRMAEDNEKMEMSTEGVGYFGKEILILDGAFSWEYKYYLLLGNPISAIS
ncbi:hypothetical protein D8674_003480 [Pyrus ussuriensis x Pyrus communis]|uniref:Uncharacterized protein n=1 Tax=Pyrus ussuriensis x Pyrus communis TaxID=2448454 RepID=A0A5N5FH73_9ROSA|nr:hypothetical protein D8674_003480 [Pyrus ussuriensis x Pyrus communis]